MKHDEERLDGLFARYRQAMPDPEPGVDFMPRLWQKIEAQQRAAWSFRRLVSGFVTAAAAVSILLVAALVVFPEGRHAVYTATYVDMLDDDQAPETVAWLGEAQEPDEEGDVQ